MAWRGGRDVRGCAAWMLFAALATVAAGCTPGRRTAGEVVFPYIDAIQQGNLEAVWCLYAGSAAGTAASDRAAFQAWARSRLVAFDRGKSAGSVDLGDDGISLVKAFGLGTGTLVGIASVRSAGSGELVVDTPATFHYEQIDASSLPPGSTFAVSVLPLGKMVTVTVTGGSGKTTLDALKTATIRWTLKRMPRKDGCGSDWGVASVAPLAGSATTAPTTWTF